MATPLLYLRDEIVIGTDLRNRIHRLCGQQPASKRLVLAARRIRHDPPDYELWIGPGTPGEPDLSGSRIREAPA